MSIKNVVEHFQLNKYASLPKFLEDETCKLAQVYAFGLLRLGPDSGYTRDNQCPLSLAKYGDPFMEALLTYKQRDIETAVGLVLFPTYSYFRIYGPNDELKPHKDREACEISCSVFLGKQYRDPNYTWPISMESNQISQQIGDAVIYKGTEVTHARQPFVQPSGSWHLQVFLHYVDANGPHKDLKFDRRPSLFTNSRNG